jgi:hypothetical protein
VNREHDKFKTESLSKLLFVSICTKKLEPYSLSQNLWNCRIQKKKKNVPHDRAVRTYYLPSWGHKCRKGAKRVRIYRWQWVSSYGGREIQVKNGQNRAGSERIKNLPLHYWLISIFIWTKVRMWIMSALTYLFADYNSFFNSTDYIILQRAGRIWL